MRIILHNPATGVCTCNLQYFPASAASSISALQTGTGLNQTFHLMIEDKGPVTSYSFDRFWGEGGAVMVAEQALT